MPANESNGAVYRFNEFRLDPATLQFRDTLVPLTPKAVDTLYLLVSRAPEVVTKDEIMKTVWPDTFVVESSLARNISVIRKALEDAGGPGEYIETIPKRGYRFVANTSPTAVPAIRPVERRSLWPGVTAAVVLLAVGGSLFLMNRGDAKIPVPNAPSLIGRHLIQKLSPVEARKAIEMYERAVAEQPASAEAHAGLARALLLLPQLGGSVRSYAKAKSEAVTALQLDPKLSAAHMAVGAASMLVDLDYAKAEKHLRQALVLDPRSTEAMVYLAMLLGRTGRSEEALKIINNAVALDPVSPMIGMQLGMLQYFQRRFEDSARQLAAVLERERHYALAHYYLALSYGFLGRYEEAEKHLAQSELNPSVLKTDSAWLALRRGDRGPAEAVYRELKVSIEKGTTVPSSTILLAASLGKLDDAYRGIEAALAEGAPELLTLASDPRLDAIRTDPRYSDVIRRIGAVRR